MCGSVAGNWRLFPAPGLATFSGRLSHAPGWATFSGRLSPAPGLATFSGKYTLLSKNVVLKCRLYGSPYKGDFVCIPANQTNLPRREKKKEELDAIEIQILKSFVLIVFHNKMIWYVHYVEFAYKSWIIWIFIFNVNLYPICGWWV